MNGLDIIILAVAVVLIFAKLRSILGMTPPAEHKVRLIRESSEKLYNILMKEAAAQNKLKVEDSAPQELIPQEDESSLSDLEKTLRKIPDFDRKRFVSAAQNAFQIITEAFNKGDIETLEMLVNKNILKKFREVIEYRQKENITAETDFICFDRTDIIRAEITAKGIARLGVEFVSQQVNVLRNAKEQVIEGDENYIQNITDVWTFERALTSTAPNWLLVSTKK